MELINIFPIANLDCGYNQNYQMLLTHLVEKYPEYVEFCQTCKGYKILDNSLIELGGSVELKRVLSAAEKIGADEIILPDVFRNGVETVKTTEAAITELNNLGLNKQYKTMAVVHGRDAQEWEWCYNKLLSMKEVDVLGIPKVCAKMHPYGRAYFVNQICQTSVKPHHLLGLWYSYTEFCNYSQIKLKETRTCDTCLTSFFTANHLPYYSTRPDGWSINLEEDALDDILLSANVSLVDKYLSSICNSKPNSF